MKQLHLYPPDGFTMRGWEPGLLNTYWCDRCKHFGLEHQVIDVPGPSTDIHSHWGPGLPTTLRQCTNCGYSDGPWVSADIVGGYW